MSFKQSRLFALGLIRELGFAQTMLGCLCARLCQQTYELYRQSRKKEKAQKR